MHRITIHPRATCRIVMMVLPAILAALTGCAPARYETTMAADNYLERQELNQSLFASDRAVMSDAAIEQILSSKVTLPDKAKVVVLNYGERRVRPWWSAEVSQLEMSAVRELTDRLKKCDRVSDASFLPSMLAPVDQTVPYLRQTAARCQADLILLYRSTHEVYRKEQILSKDEVRSYCMVEAVLIDTRTGIVPFTTAVMNDYQAKKEPSDLDLSETIRKAQLRATGEALRNVADEMVAFLQEVPRRTAPQVAPNK